MQTRQEYSHAERINALKRLNDAVKQSLTDRKEAKATWFEALTKYPDLIPQRIDWLINGSYGYGEMLLAKEVLARTRSNRVAALAQLIACFEWGCDAASARSAFRQLTPEQQARVNNSIQAVIDKPRED